MQDQQMFRFPPQIRKGLQCLSQRIIGSNTIIQGALPAILRETPQNFFDDVIHTLYVSLLDSRHTKSYGDHTTRDNYCKRIYVRDVRYGRTLISRIATAKPRRNNRNV